MVVNAITLPDPEGIDRVFAALPTNTDAILLENSTINLLAQERLCTLSTQHRSPSVSTVGEVAEAGCLMSYGENLPESIGEPRVMSTRFSKAISVVICRSSRQ
jgi:hypothetical protein